MKHFEHLWEDAEKIDFSSSKENLVNELKDLFIEYNKTLKSKFSEETHKELASRSFGKILFYLAQLSKVENINVYEALQKEIKIQEVELLED